MAVGACVGSDCRVTHFTLSALTATDWAGSDADGKKISGKVGKDTGAGHSYKDMQDAFEKALSDYYKPNPKFSECEGTCVCRDTGVQVSTTTTPGLEFDIPYPSLGKDGKVSGTYTLEVSVTRGQCGPPKKIVLPRLVWLSLKPDRRLLVALVESRGRGSRPQG